MKQGEEQKTPGDAAAQKQRVSREWGERYNIGKKDAGDRKTAKKDNDSITQRNGGKKKERGSFEGMRHTLVVFPIKRYNPLKRIGKKRGRRLRVRAAANRGRTAHLVHDHGKESTRNWDNVRQAPCRCKPSNEWKSLGKNIDVLCRMDREESSQDCKGEGGEAVRIPSEGR